MQDFFLCMKIGSINRYFCKNIMERPGMVFRDPGILTKNLKGYKIFL